MHLKKHNQWEYFEKCEQENKTSIRYELILGPATLKNVNVQRFFSEKLR
jgi:hypothetical protein